MFLRNIFFNYDKFIIYRPQLNVWFNFADNDKHLVCDKNKLAKILDTGDLMVSSLTDLY